MASNTSGAYCQTSSKCSSSTSSAAVPTDPNRKSAARTRRKPTSGATSVQRDVPLEPRHFLVVDVLADLTSELLHRLVGAVLLEFVQHALPHPRDAQDIGVARGVQVDRDEYVLFEPGHLF